MRRRISSLILGAMAFLFGLMLLAVPAGANGFGGPSCPDASTTFDFTASVAPFIQAASHFNVDFTSNPIVGPDFEANYTSPYYFAAYANCPLTITVRGDNAAGDGVPVFAREETDEDDLGIGQFDRLDTRWGINVSVDGTAWTTAAWAGNTTGHDITNRVAVTFGGQDIFYLNRDFLSRALSHGFHTPHRGAIILSFSAFIDGPSFTGGGGFGEIIGNPGSGDWWLSPDAGDYSATIVVEYTKRP